jgi:hypothetical protein
VFWKTTEKCFSPKTLFGFPENHYGFFMLCEKPLWVSRVGEKSLFLRCPAA